MKYQLREILYFLFNKIPTTIIGKLKGNLVKVHWDRGLNNFGDCLQPATLKYYGLTPVYVSSKEKADVILAGSILQDVPKEYSGFIIGTGGDKKIYSFPKAEIIAVRGNLTKSNLAIMNDKDVLLGDAGILMPLIYPNKEKKIYDLGIIPHFVDRDESIIRIWKQRFTNTIIINVLEKPEIVIKQIKQCKNISSSSLHGLIIAEAFEIPTLWLFFQKLLDKEDFYSYKFYDYYSSLNYKPKKYIPTGDETKEILINMATIKPKEKIDKLIEGLDRKMKEFSSIIKLR